MSDQGTTYFDFIAAELDAERARRASFDERGKGLVTSSGGLVTLLTGLAAFVKNGVQVDFPVGSLVALFLALLFFAAAAGCGILAGWNRHYAVTKVATLDRMCAEHWMDDEIDARNNVARARTISVDTLRLANNVKARFVSTGLVMQLCALVAMSAAVVTLVVLT